MIDARHNLDLAPDEPQLLIRLVPLGDDLDRCRLPGMERFVVG
jgi:hypothetical protein